MLLVYQFSEPLLSKLPHPTSQEDPESLRSHLLKICSWLTLNCLLVFDSSVQLYWVRKPRAREEMWPTYHTTRSSDCCFSIGTTHSALSRPLPHPHQSHSLFLLHLLFLFSLSLFHRAPLSQIYELGFILLILQIRKQNSIGKIGPYHRATWW